ncbi:MAG: hypothetical protein AVDCRST_MAG49-3097 [uncultured Thermomicrobiales bacterium]|uniref:Methyltransferase type 11 domain-containing protein n=1 Tax=uncultured Thermomicrobiales bacterium TaxID=1645740 RepID=A0A6J4V287_9BACT|nr:MAG: hypothetical protein AVDCRST_MAG49-3097 [uncultured Thermomicrobiales bacterium]
MTEERPDAGPAEGTVLPMWEEPDVVGAFARWHPAAVVFYRPATEALLAAAGVAPGTRLLDVGTGTGIPAVRAAELVGPDGVVAATDPSAGLLAAAEANARAAGAGNLSFRRAGAEALPFPDAGFDAVVSHLGLMFVADLPRALAEVRRVLCPGGRAAFLAWGPYAENPFWTVFHGLAKRYREGAAAEEDQEVETDPAPEEEPDPRHPFRFAEPGSLLAALRAAGFADAREETRRVSLRLPDPEPIRRFWLDVGRADEDLPAPRRQAFRDEVLAAYRAFAAGDGVELPAVFVVGSGATPSAPLRPRT